MSPFDDEPRRNTSDRSGPDPYAPKRRPNDGREVRTDGSDAPYRPHPDARREPERLRSDDDARNPNDPPQRAASRKVRPQQAPTAGQSRERRMIDQKRRQYVRRQRRKKILLGVVGVLGILMIGVGLLVNYVTGGARFNLRPTEPPEDFTLPPMETQTSMTNQLIVVDPTDPTDDAIATVPVPVPPGTETESTDPNEPTEPIEPSAPIPSEATEDPVGDVTRTPTPPVSTTETLFPPVYIPEEDLAAPGGSGPNDVLNILLLGVDTRDMDHLNENSDTIMVLTVDRTNGELKLTSIQRDILVYIPGREQHGERKINEAMYFGPDKALETVNYYLQLDMTDYIVVNIAGAEEIVDAVGGIRIDVPTEPAVLEYYNACIFEQNVMMEDDPDKYVPGFEEGGEDILVNGRQAIAYARMREVSDYQRMGRQREVLQKLFTKLKSSDPITMTNTIRAGFNQIATSYSLTEMVDLATDLLPVLQGELGQTAVPLLGTYWEDSGYHWVNRVNWNLNIPKIHDYIFGPSETRTVPLVPNPMNAPPDLTSIDRLPEELRENPIPPGYYPIGKEWPQLEGIEWQNPPRTPAADPE